MPQLENAEKFTEPQKYKVKFSLKKVSHDLDSFKWKKTSTQPEVTLKIPIKSTVSLFRRGLKKSIQIW